MEKKSIMTVVTFPDPGGGQSYLTGLEWRTASRSGRVPIDFRNDTSPLTPFIMGPMTNPLLLLQLNPSSTCMSSKTTL